MCSTSVWQLREDSQRHTHKCERICLGYVGTSSNLDNIVPCMFTAILNFALQHLATTGLDSQDSTVTLSPNETTIRIIDNDGKSVCCGKILDIECSIP